MWQIIEEAGWPIWLNILASVIGLAIILERLWIMRPSAGVPRHRVQLWCKARDKAPENANASLIDRIAQAAFIQSNQSSENLQNAMEHQARIERQHLDQFLNTLGTIAAMAPLMGLLGTVIGMIEIFASQGPSESDPAQLARGISIALYNTAFGLMVAIVAMIFYRHLRDHEERLLTHAEIAAAQILRAWKENP